MNISIRNRTVRAIVVASALGVAFGGGVVTGRAADATPERPVVRAAAVEPNPPPIYYVTDGQTPHDIAVAESITLQERVLTGIIAPERPLHFMNDTEAGWMTAMEVVLVATSGQ